MEKLKNNMNKDLLSQDNGKNPLYLDLLLFTSNIPIIGFIFRKILVFVFLILTILGFPCGKDINKNNKEAAKYERRKCFHSTIWALYVISCFLCFILFVIAFLFYIVMGTFDIFVDEKIEKAICHTLLSPIYLILAGIVLSILLNFYKKHFITPLEIPALGLKNYVKQQYIDLREISIIKINKEKEPLINDCACFIHDCMNVELAVIQSPNTITNQFITKIELPMNYDFKTIIKHKFNELYDDEIKSFERLQFLYPDLNKFYEIHTTNTEDTMNMLTVGFIVSIFKLSKKQKIKAHISIENNYLNIQFNTTCSKIEFNDIKQLLEIIQELNVKKYFFEN